MDDYRVANKASFLILQNPLAGKDGRHLEDREEADSLLPVEKNGPDVIPIGLECWLLTRHSVVYTFSARQRAKLSVH